MENAAVINRTDEDWEDMPELAAQNTSAQGQPQDVQYLDIGHYHIANGHPPLHENHDHAINNYAEAVLDVPAQVQAVPSDPVCSNVTCTHTHI